MAECAMTQEFLNYLKFEKHISDYTARCYGADLEQFVGFLHGQGSEDHGSSVGESFSSWGPDSGGVATATKTETKVEEQILTADVNVIRRFMTALAEKQYCKSTTARKLATLRSFYKFLVKRNYVTGNPVTTIKTPKQDKRLPRFLEFEEVQKLLNTPHTDNWLGVRDRAILETLYSTGMRARSFMSAARARRNESPLSGPRPFNRSSSTSNTAISGCRMITVSIPRSSSPTNTANA